MNSLVSTGWSRIARRIRVPLGFIFTALYLWLAHPTWISILCGGLVALIGLIIRAFASGHVKKNEELATSGPYAYTRNPLYLGSLILAGGFSLAALSWWIAIIAALIFMVIYVPVIRSEETFLRAQFPGFAEYAQRVPVLFPRLSSSLPSNDVFSWDLYLKHREYNAAIGSAALIAALAAKLFWILRQSSNAAGFIFWQ